MITNSLLKSIRDNPLQFLPQPSLEAFSHFRNGYLYRLAMEGQPPFWHPDPGFHDWLCNRFKLVGCKPIADTSIVISFATSEREAFDMYFSLLDQYRSLGRPAKELPNPGVETKNFVETIKGIRERPPLYVGHATFLGCCSYLMGDEQAYKEMTLPSEEGRELFHDFQKWVEIEKNSSQLHRPWFKVIEFWSGGIDCGHASSGAFSLFFKWLDQYSTRIGRRGFFTVNAIESNRD